MVGTAALPAQGKVAAASPAAATTTTADGGVSTAFSLGGSTTQQPLFDKLLSQKELTFVVSPPEIVFRNYEPFQTYECPLVFKNQTRHVQSMKVLAPKNKYFNVSEPRTSGKTLRVAAGLSVAYTVGFRPEEDIDYTCDLVVVTEAERFIVQVKSCASLGRLDLPRSFHFTNPVVKHRTEKVVLLRNVGIKPTTFAIDVPPPWSVTPPSGHLEPGENLQMSLFFKPERCEVYKGDMNVSYSNGDVTAVGLYGEAKDVDVSLSHSVLHLEPTFISLERQGSVTLVNNSDVTVSYEWKAHAALEDELEEKGRLSSRLVSSLGQEREMIVSSVGSRTDSSGASLAATKRQLRALERRGRARCQTLDEGSLLFEHDYFTIEPLRGEVPARSKRTIVVTFNPQLATSCEVGAYLDVVGRAGRIPLQLKGQGIGPKCQFSYDALDLGDVFISSIHRYELMLQNRGSIDARFSLNQNATVFANNFKFTPSHGTVPPGESQVIGIEFCSDQIGILNESFFFHIQGSRSDLGIHFKGRVIGPTFHFDTDEIDFGNVSYNFMHRKVFTLLNTSEIPMRFRLRVPEDNGPEKEFEMIPTTGLVLPLGKQKIILDFLSNTVQEYNAHLIVDVDEVGENLHSVPLKASCVVPHLSLVQESLSFGKDGICFVGHPYDVAIEVRNDTQLASKYDVGLPPDDDPIRRKLDINVLNRRGIVPAGSVHQINVRLTAKMVGGVHLPIYVRVLGRDKRLPVSVSAKVCGPVVTIDHSTIDFGKVHVLHEHCKRLEMVNESPIPAVFSCKLLNKAPNAFQLKNTETTIPPKSSYSLPVYAYLDDTTKFSDEFVITIANSKDLHVHVTAVGTGTTLVPSISLEHDVDFGSIFTTTVAKRTFTMYNKGKRQLAITWANDRAKPKEGDAPYTFVVLPERATIPGKCEQEFTFEGIHDKAGRASERFICKLTKTHKTVFRPTVVGLFVVPLLDVSEKCLSYTYTWEAGSDTLAMRQTKPLTLRNVSPMMLTFQLKAGAPFAMDKTDYTLKPGESCTVHVDLHAGYRGDRTSHKIKTKLTIAYKDHTQRDSVDLLADIVFPNLSIEASSHITPPAGEVRQHVVDFGCIMHETEKRLHVVITNCSKVNAQYEWVFEQTETVPRTLTGELAGSSGGVSAAATHKSAAGGKKEDQAGGYSAFDILPIRGFLPPGGSERVEFVYYSQSEKKARATAVLVVEGGPEYTVGLAGEASSMQFRFDRSVLDFGNIPFERYEERELFLANNGRVAFHYTVDLSQFPKPGLLEVTPSSGQVKGGERQRLVARLYPRVPDKIEAYFQVSVAHFEPHSIYVSGIGLYPSVSLTGHAVSRVRPLESPALLETAQSLLDADSRRYFLRVAAGGAFDTTTRMKRSERTDGESARVTTDLEEEIERLYFAKVLAGDLPVKEALVVTEPSPATPAVSREATLEPGEEALSLKQEACAGPPMELVDTPDETEASVDPYASRFLDGRPIVACYTIDFGTIVKGDVKKKVIRLVNTSSTSLNIVIDKRKFAGTGITVSPEKFQKLAGHPTYQEQVIEIQLATKGDKAKDVTYGHYRLTIPIDVKGSGYIRLTVKAFIMVPQLVVSHAPLDAPLDFLTTTLRSDGTTAQRGTTVGEARIVTLQFRNPLPLPCEWTARCDLKRQQPKNQFLCKPDKGILLPKQRCTMEVTFVPHEGGLTNGVLSLRIAHNPRTIQIPCVGLGEELVVDVVPPRVTMPVVHPFQTTEQDFTLKNSSQRAIEIYALSYDKMHVVEENILRAVKIYNSDGVGYLPPRQVGGSLEPELVEEYYALLEERDAELGSAIVHASAEGSAADTPSAGARAGAPDQAGGGAPPATAAAAAAAAAAAEASAGTGEAVAGPVVVVHGPPLSGKTTMASLIAKQYDCEVLDIDVLFEEVAESDTVHGLHVKNLLDPWPGSEGKPPNEAQLATVLRTAFHGLRTAVVIDGLQCRAVENPEVLAAAVTAACGTQDLHLVTLDLDPQCIDLRAAHMAEEACVAAQEAAKVEEISEDVYDAMQPAARRAHERALKRLRQCRKETKAATQARLKLEKARAEFEGERPTLQQIAERDEEERRKTEEEEASVKKKPAKGGKTAAVSDTPEVPEMELTPLDAFKKSFAGVVRALQATQTVNVVNDNTQPAEAIIDELMQDKLPAPRSPEKSAEDDAQEYINPPLTRLRVERPKPNKGPRKCEWFTIIDKASQPATPTAPPPEKGGKGAPPPPAKEEVAPSPPTRWILEPGDAVKLTLQFKASQTLPEGYQDTIDFGIVGSKHTVSLAVAATCVYPDVVRDPKQAFTTRRAVKKGVFDFGPLLVRDGKIDAGKGAASTRRQSVAKEGAGVDLVAGENLKVSSLPLFDSEVTWAFGNAEQKVFSVSAPTTKIKAGATEHVRLLAAPDGPGLHETQLIGFIKDNPKPVSFSLQCLGSLPEVDIGGCDETSAEGRVLDFGRLLLDVKHTKEFSLSNGSLVPLRWELMDSSDAAKKLRQEFTVEVPGQKEHAKAKDEKDAGRVIAKGRLDAKGGAGSKEVVHVTFQAPKADVMKSELSILIKDEQDAHVLHTLPVKFLAEAYDIYLEATDEVSFGKNGLVKVGMKHKQQIKLSNRGKYDFSYEVHLKRKYEQYFTITPVSGILKAKEPALALDVTFESKGEVVFREAAKAEFEVNIYQGIEPGQLGPVVGSKTIYAEVEARSLRFQVMPSHGLNFGPCLCHDKKKMPLSILNNGPFELRFRLYDFATGPGDTTSSTPDPDKTKGAKKAPKEPKSAGTGLAELEIGAFKISPVEGVVSPGDSREVNVVLDPKSTGAQAFAEKLGVFIEDCNPLEAPAPLLLEGESCAPGINADLSSPEGEAVFEEQQVVTRVDASFKKLRSVFAKEDRVFSFGSIITRQSVTESFRISNPFTVPCIVSASITRRGESEGAAAAMSAFHLAWKTPLSGTPATNAGTPDGTASMTIPPHEHRYVTVTFTPAEMRSYFALFQAVVQDGTDPRSKALVFEVRGEGSLPQLQVELQPPPPPRVTAEPAAVDAKGKPVKADPKKVDASVAKAPPNTLVFYRTIVGRKNVRYVTVHNVGVLPAEFRFATPARERGASPFHFPARNEVHELEPGCSDSYAVYFEPTTAETSTAKITMSVTDNSFEDTVITLQGEAYEEEVTFESLDDGCDNFLTLADCGVGQTVTKAFKLESHTAHPVRYSWTCPEKFTVVPSAGHLMPHQTKEVKLQYCSAEPEELEKLKLSLKHAPIKLRGRSGAAGATGPWDSAMTSVKWVPDITPPPSPKASPTPELDEGKKGAGKKGAAAAAVAPVEEAAAPAVPELSEEEAAAAAAAKALERKRRPLKKVVEMTPEPTIEYLNGTGGEGENEEGNLTKDLFVKVCCGYAEWEIAPDAEGKPLSDLRFSSTQLFQSRCYPVVLRNSGKISLECTWSLTAPSGQELSQDMLETFKVEPDYCRVPAGSSHAFKVFYAPLDTEQHVAFLQGCVPNVKRSEDGTSPQPAITVRGTSECPLVHFDLSESDYLTSGRRNPDVSSASGDFLEPSKSKVVEFQCAGVKIRRTRRFFVLNPTNMSYEYEWVDHTTGPDAKKFTCSNTKGVIHSGKKAEMVFDFTPETLDVKEACYEFVVGGRSTDQYFKSFSVPFLLVGRPTEPNIVLHPSRVNYEQVLLGARAKKVVKLTNSEPIPFAFNFQVGRGVVSVSPMSGSIPANSSIPVEVCFAPTSEETYNINIVCTIKKKTNALTCNVKGEGYSIHESVVVRSADGSTVVLNAGETNTVDFGRQHINSKQTKQLIITNSGRLNFDYKWVRAPSPLIALSPEIDTIGKSGKSVCDLSFHPTRVTTVDNYKMVCKITNGATYTVAVNGAGVQPNVHFSCTKIDFGLQFVQVHGSRTAHVRKYVLTITNQDSTDVSFESNIDLPPWLESDATPTVLAKAGTKEGGHYTDRKDVTFTFKPQESGKVDFVIPFEINGMFTVPIHACGEGTIPRIELVTGQSGSVNFGSVRTGDLKTIVVKAVCKSKIPTPFSLAGALPAELSHGSLVTVTPADAVILKPRETRAIEFKYRPPVGLRMAPFSYNIDADIAGVKKHFVTLLGSSMGVEVHLDQKTLSFGTVVQGTHQTRRLLIMNTGDVPVSYHFPDLDGMGYSVNHPSGSMPPHSEQACDVTFAPTSILPQGNRELQIRITDSTVHPHTTRTLPLSLVGVCSKRPAVAEEHLFKCAVREKCQKVIKVVNVTSEEWVLPPALDSQCWTVQDKLTVPANGSADLVVTYAPLMMTKTSSKGEREMDKGTLFLPVPTGDAKQMMHSLVGEAAPPGAAGEIEESITAKATHTTFLDAHNWSSAPQRFSVAKDFMLVPSGGATPVPVDASVTLQGGSTIDVPAKATRKYKLVINSLKECKIKGTVRFVNDTTKEYLFYNVAWTVGPSQDLKVLRMQTPARQVATEDVYIENPCDTSVTMDVTSSGASGELHHPERLTFEPRSVGLLHLTYMPLVGGQQREAKLQLRSPELGDYPYTVQLQSLPSVPEKAVRFQTPLGLSQQVTLRLRSLAKVPCDFTCKFVDPKSPFSKTQQPMVVKVAAATKPEGEELCMDLTFEPCRLGEARDVLEVTSPVGGTFEVPLVGTCTLPQRQGPFECKAGQGKALPFRNVFNDALTYSFTVDSPSFTLNKPSEAIPPKKDTTLAVTFKALPEDPPNPKAKVTISCVLEGSASPIQWVYYLSGTN